VERAVERASKELKIEQNGTVKGKQVFYRNLVVGTIISTFICTPVVLFLIESN
jgi:hypothetical protein